MLMDVGKGALRETENYNTSAAISMKHVFVLIVISSVIHAIQTSGFLGNVGMCDGRGLAVTEARAKEHVECHDACKVIARVDLSRRNYVRARVDE